MTNRYAYISRDKILKILSFYIFVNDYYKIIKKISQNINIYY